MNRFVPRKNNFGSASEVGASETPSGIEICHNFDLVYMYFKPNYYPLRSPQPVPVVLALDSNNFRFAIIC